MLDLGIERHQGPAWVTIRIHLDQLRSFLEVEPVERARERGELADLRAAAQAKGKLARPERCSPAAGWMLTERIFSGVLCATSSISMPPAAE